MARHLPIRHLDETTVREPRRRSRTVLITAAAMALLLVPAGLASRSHNQDAAAATVLPVAKIQNASTVHLVWSDEFNSTAIDTNKWRVRNNTWATNELSMATSRTSNIYEAQGVLRITPRREKYTAYGVTRNYTSGYVDGRTCFTHAVIEYRAMLPTKISQSKGMWPALWLRPAAGGDGEIDIMEAIGTSTYDDRVSQTLWYDYKGTYPRQNAAPKLPLGGTRSGQFHVYSIDWQKNLIRWYIDGVLTYQRDLTTTPWLADARFNQPYCLRLNLQIGGKWPGTPDSTTNFAQVYSVDWVRVFQR